MRLAMSSMDGLYLLYPMYNKYIYVYVTSVPRKHSHESAWCCHMALSATPHPRGLARISPPFTIYLNILID